MPRKSTRIPRVCRQCGADFAVIPSDIKRGRDKHCSAACQWASQRKDPARIWDRGIRSASGCLEWSGARSPQGYGQVVINGRLELVHRVAWSLKKGPIPDGLNVLHHCDNRPCFEPEHLFVGTDADNVRDMIAKGRARHDETPRGESHWRTRLTDVAVREIRQRYAAGGVTLKALGQEYGVHLSTIASIVHRKNWGHVV